MLEGGCLTPLVSFCLTAAGDIIVLGRSLVVGGEAQAAHNLMVAGVIVLGIIAALGSG